MVRRSFSLLTAVLIALVSWDIWAQTPPNAGRVLQETQPQPERVPALSAPPIRVPLESRPALPAVDDDVRVAVTQIEFTGNKAFSADALHAIVAPWAGRSLNFGELMQVVEAIEAHYKEAGYFLAQAYLPPQKIRNGTIEIAIGEGLMGEGRIEGESRIAAGVLFGYLDHLPKGKALTLPLLERQVLLINELAGGRTSLDLQAGENSGSTDVVLVQQLENLVTGHLEANNHGSPYTGEKLYDLGLNANSPFNRGERISLNAQTSDARELTSYNLRGELPVGGDGWHLIATASRAEYRLGGAFANLDASGTADSLRLGAAYPLIRSRTNTLKVQVEADHTRLADKFQLSGTKLDKQSRALTATLSEDWLDNFMGSGSTHVGLALRTGQLTLGPDAAAQDAPPAGPGSAGHFSKVVLTALREQTLTRDISLQLQVVLQGAGRNLDSSEKLLMGGPVTLPGYANGEASGDSGAFAKLGLHCQLLPELSLTAFTDYAHLHLAHDPLPTSTNNDRQLSDLGISANWLIDKHFTANALLAWAGKETPNPTDNHKFWLSLGYAW